MLNITTAMQYTIGTGRYRIGARYSELKHLLTDGYDLLQQFGLVGEKLRNGAHLYAKVFRQYYQQSGTHHLNKALEAELTDRVLAELQLDPEDMRHTTGLTRSEFNYGITLYDPRMCGLQPFIPATLPDPAPHSSPGIPEEYVEQPLSPITDESILESVSMNSPTRSRD